MKRTTIMLPEDLKARALNHANRMGLSLGGFIRECLEKSLQGTYVNQADEDPFFADNEVYEGRIPKDFVLEHDEYLYGDGA